MSIEKKFDQILDRYQTLQKQLEQPIDDPKKFASMSKELASMDEIYQAISEFKNLIQQKKDAEEMLNDPEVKELALEELSLAKKKTCKFRAKNKGALIT